jgi:transposase
MGRRLPRAKLAGLSHPLPPETDDAALERLLFPPSEPSSVQWPAPAWPTVHNELRRKGVTLELLWQEYKAEQADGYQYSAFCEHYRRWRQRLTLSMRQTHTPGERLFIDYAGQTVGVTDGTTGEIREAQVFVAVLGASNYTYLEATWSQQLPDWIGSHVRALEFFGGCTEQFGLEQVSSLRWSECPVCGGTGVQFRWNTQMDRSTEECRS